MAPILTLHSRCACPCRKGCSIHPLAIRRSAFLYFNTMHSQQMYEHICGSATVAHNQGFPILHLALVDKMCPHKSFPFLPWLESHMKTNSESVQTGEKMICIHTVLRGFFSRICSLGQLVSSVCLFSSNLKHTRTHTW